MGEILRAEGISKTYHTGRSACIEKMRHSNKKR